MQRKFHIIITLILVVCSCGKYHKGDMYTSTVTGDSMQYIIFTKGMGKKISEVASGKKSDLEHRGSECVIKYLTDSAQLENQNGLLLINTKLPDVENDMLTDGFFGTLTTKQNVTILLVSVNDLEQFFSKTTAVQKKDRPF